MFIGHLRVEIYIPYSRSLKDRRQVSLSLKDRLRRRFNVSVAEEPSNTWQRFELSCVYVTCYRQAAQNMMAKIEEYCRMSGEDIHVINSECEVF